MSYWITDACLLSNCHCSFKELKLLWLYVLQLVLLNELQLVTRLYIDICIWYESVHCNPKVLSTLVWSYEYIIKSRCRFFEVLVCSVVHIVYSMYYTCTGSNFTGEFLCCKEIGIRIWIVKCMYTPVKLDYYKHGESKITVLVKVLWDPQPFEKNSWY